MARVSDASRTGPEGGRSAPSPLGREGAEGGLSKLIRSAGGREGLSVPFVSPSSRLGVSKSYVSESSAKKSFNMGVSRLRGAGAEEMGVTGRGEGTSATS